MDNPLPEYPKTDIVVPSPARHCIPTNERGGWYFELIYCVVRRMRWHCVYFVVGGGRDAIGIACQNLPPKRAIWIEHQINEVRTGDEHTPLRNDKRHFTYSPHVIFQLLHMSKQITGMLRRLRNTTRQDIPTTKPRLRILPYR
jgi:hypothetical protein